MEKLNFENPKKQFQEESERLEHFAKSKFRTGELSFDFNFSFPNGIKIEGHQDKKGIGHVRIRGEKKIIFNAEELLPSGWKFVTPAYFEKSPEEETLDDYLFDTWSTSYDRKLILLGQMDSPKEILTLLHEIGHSINDSLEDLKIMKQLLEEKKAVKNRKDLVYKTLLGEEEAKISSKVERRAWAYAIKMLKKIAREADIDLDLFFANFNDLKRFINDSLATYRRPYETIITKGYDKEFYKELQKYFDRWEYAEKK